MPRDITRQELLGDLTDDELTNGIPVAGFGAVRDAGHSASMELNERHQRAVRLAGVMSNASYHLGLVRLLDEFPEVEAVAIGKAHPIDKGNLRKSVTLDLNDHLDGLPLRQRSRSERRLDALRSALPFNTMDQASVSMLFRRFTSGDSFRLTRANVPDYLDLTLGVDLFRLWFVRHEQAVLREVLPNGDAPPTSVPRSRL